MVAIDQERDQLDDEGHGITLSVHPYDVGCDVDPQKKVHVDVRAAVGDGLGERIIVRSEDDRYEFRRNHWGKLECIDPPGEDVPGWARAAIVETGVGRVQE